MNTDNLIGRIEVKSSVVGNAPGIKGEKGDTGTGIKSITLNDDYTLTITYTDDNSMTTDSIRGEKGEKGDKGKDGINGKDGAIQYTAGDGVKIENNIISAFTKTSELENDSNFITSSGDTIAEINNKINNIGKVVNLFGDILGTSGSETLSLYSHIVATKIGTDIWKFDIEGQMDIANPANNYEWGIMPSKISALLNAAIGKQVQYDESLRKQGNWDIIKSSDKLPYLNFYNYGTTFEYNANQYLLFARYYTTEGSVGGYDTQAFEPSTHVYATIYLKEV